MLDGALRAGVWSSSLVALQYSLHYKPAKYFVLQTPTLSAPSSIPLIPRRRDAPRRIVWSGSHTTTGEVARSYFQGWGGTQRSVTFAKTSQVRCSISVLCNPGNLKVWVDSAEKMYQIPQNVLKKPKNLLKEWDFMLISSKFRNHGLTSGLHRNAIVPLLV